MTVKLFESELRVMDLLWKEGDMPAKEIALRLKEQIGWSKTTKTGRITGRTRIYLQITDKQGRSTKSRNKRFD